MARHVPVRGFRPVLVLLVTLVTVFPARAAWPEGAARKLESEAHLRKDINFLASPECEGRGPTTLGLIRAGDHIANEFKKAGLKPGNPDGTYFYNYTIPGAVLDAPATLTLHGPQGRELVLQQGVHFFPMGSGGAGKVEGAKAAFAGYGRKFPADFKGRIGNDTVILKDYDDFADIDVKGKVVLVINDTPRSIRPDGGRRPQGTYFTQMVLPKIEQATKAGAAAVLFVHNLETAKTGDDLYDFGYSAIGRRAAQATIPVLHIHRNVLDTLLAGSANPDLTELEEAIDRDLKPKSFDLSGWTIDLEVKMHRGEIKLRNVIGVLEGKGPLADETVVVGAHYDHLGYGGAGGSLGNPRKMIIHPGADDNGSGSTSIMELARRFAAMPDRQGRRLVFMTFSGEELGLLGSEAYCKNPLIPINKTVAMLNLDMVGRVPVDTATKKDKLIVEALGTGKEFKTLIDTLNKKHDFLLSKKDVVIPYSDHSSFYDKGVPVLFLWNGDHENYHKPSDTADRINIAGMRHVVDLAEDILVSFTTEKKPEFQKVAGSGPRRPSSDGPTLGITPDFTEEVEGVLIKEVRDGGPASKAGIKAGDRVVELAGKPVKDLTGYAQVMVNQKLGETIEVVVIRDGKMMTIKVKLE
jgi:hypothetical protein